MEKSLTTIRGKLGAALLLLTLLIAFGVATGTARPALAAQGTFEFSMASFSGAEGDNAILTVERSGGNDPASIHYTITANNAEPGDYFNATEGSVSFGLNEPAHNISIPTHPNDGDSDDDIFTVTLDNSNGGDAIIGNPFAAVYTILDNDGPPNFSITNLTVVESIGSAVVTVTRSGSLAAGQQVTFFTSDGTATAGSDYTAVGDSVLVFGDGVATRTVPVPITDDAIDEAGDETVNLNLKDPSDSGSVTGTPWTLTIQDNENGVIEFTSATYSITEGDVVATVGLKRTGGTAGSVSVDCDSISGGTASSPSDYTAFSNQTVTFVAGDTSETCSITIKEDVIVEGNETINLRIDTPTGGAVIGTQSTAVFTIIDDETDSTVQFSASNYTITEGVGIVTATVNRTGTTTSQATVVYTTSTGTAGTPGDYTHKTGTLTFPVGNTTQTFTVSITDDVVLESTETFNVALSSPTSVGLGAQSAATITIIDNDGNGPIVTGVTPDNGPTVGGTVVVIAGSNFTGATAVTFGQTPATSFTVNGDSSITATVPAQPLGAVSVVVTNGNGASNANIMYTYGAGLPAITTLAPNTGPVAGGTVVVITGIRFTGVTSVSFGGTAAAFTFNSDTQITATAPAHVAGTANVVVTTPAGVNTNTASDDFAYTSTSGKTFVYTLYFRWSLVVWTGANNANVQNALKGIETPDNPATTNVFSQVTSFYTWDNVFQVWLAYFPKADEQNIPGANDFTTLKNGVAYWIAVVGPGQTTWTIIEG